MTASKTKKKTGDNKFKRGLQLVVFAPINADPDDEEHRIYMVCPSSLKVVEVVEKFGEEADAFLDLLGKKKLKKGTTTKDFEESTEKKIKNTNEAGVLIEDNSGLAFSEDKDMNMLSDELEDEVLTVFASEGLGSIFPDDEESRAGIDNGDIDEIASLLDDDSADSELDDMSDFFGDGDDDDFQIPTL